MATTNCKPLPSSWLNEYRLVGFPNKQITKLEDDKQNVKSEGNPTKNERKKANVESNTKDTMPFCLLLQNLFFFSNLFCVKIGR